MNRILFEPSEVRDGLATFSDVRAEHVLGVLHGEVGQTLKTGIIDGPIGTSVIERIDGNAVTVRCTHDASSLPSWIDLILAPPRPRSMKRLLPQLASLGVRRIFLVGAEKVEKAFWGAQLLREEIYRPFLVDGLQQAGTTQLPTIHVSKNFAHFMKRNFDLTFEGQIPRIVAHPYAAGTTPQSFHSVFVQGRIPVLAVGPEGGWTDAELALLEERGFERMSLGPRILRTDTALVALLGILMSLQAP